MVYKSFHNGKYFISFKRGFEETRRDITISIDKMQEKDSLRISLSDDEDPAFLCRIVLTRCDYEDLKKQQGLLIDFENFPSQMVKLLQQCSSNNMFLIVHQVSPIQYNFEIVEHNEFRRLVHLSLKTGPANDDEVKQHMSETISQLKNSLSSLKSALSSTEMLWKDKCLKIEAKVHDLTHTVSIMEDEKARHQKEFQEALKLERDRLKDERLQWQRSSEMNTNNLLACSQENLNKKDKQISELNSQNQQLHERNKLLENQLSERAHRCNLLENEVQAAHMEVATLKAKNAILEKEMIERDRTIADLSSKCTYIDKTIKDNNTAIKELNETIQTLKMEKGTLERRLAISESLANKNNEAAHTTTEQLIKANQIISKQNNDLIEIKEKLLCRTEIALEQEKVIEQNTKEIYDLKSEIGMSRKNMEELKKEIQSLKEKFEHSEKALKDRDETIKNNNMVIQWLHKKIEETGFAAQTDGRMRGINSASSSTPYLAKNNHQPIEEITEESVNFYEPSKSSNFDDSHTPLKTVQKGIDPKYLKPASDDNRKSKESIQPMSSQSSKGKENKNTELPKVDYREKKSSRGTTYRATPVSAYFP
ncbi:spindle assembly abnormal protein 6 homolog [Aricia agestis]|uniref:spindle assembly abnormal protein 6 homolog n=1 Tax=Aricia agestis TaxID=91739 RepID=UPI001C2074BC|nr:spindle assembly abnormal protein 6 homolog [Aricia agestis]